MYVKFLVCTSNGSVMRVHTDTLTHTHTGPILLPLPLMQEVKISDTYFSSSV